MGKKQRIDQIMEWLASLGIAENLQQNISVYLKKEEFGNLQVFLSERGFAHEFVVELVYRMTHGRPLPTATRAHLNSFDEELGEKLKDPEFRKLFTEEMEKNRKGHK